MLRILIMSLMIFGLFDTLLTGPGVIPTRVEQANLLANVRDVFENIKFVVNVEANVTDESIINDVERSIERAKVTLSLIQELAFAKLSFTSNTVCGESYRDSIMDLIKESSDAFEGCTSMCLEKMKENSNKLANATIFATEKGERLLDMLTVCSAKIGMDVISCYRGVIAKDIVPLKKYIFDACDAHLDTQQSKIKIKHEVYECVEKIVENCEKNTRDLLQRAYTCV